MSVSFEPTRLVRCNWDVQQAIWLRRRSLLAGAAELAGTGVVIAVVVFLIAGQIGPRGSSADASGSDRGTPVPALPPSSVTSPDPSPVLAAKAIPTLTSTAACDVTQPEPAFVPPKGFVATPPAYYESTWYGSTHLWTMLRDGGEVWGPGLSISPTGLPQKTFWWSADWVVRDELEPDISVTGRRLDGPGSFTFGSPGTNASADFGTAMLVGIDIPSYGCWEITARYREARISYIVLVRP